MQTKKLWIGANLPADDPELSRVLSDYHITTEPSIEEGVKLLNSGQFSVAIFTINSSAEGTDRALQHVLHDPHFPVIVHHPQGTIDDAIRLTRQGAFYVLLGEVHTQRLEHAINKALERGRHRAAPESDVPAWRRGVIGHSRAIQHICEVIQLIASKHCTVLISGETGTGKEVIAKAIHNASNRCGRPLVSVNCTALPATLVETELFGHAKGAFTGAAGSRIGRFEQANRSTLFLDEVGDLPYEAQAKLLRVLQEQEFERVGSSETIRVDVRVLAASNVDLEDAIKQKRFREDLYYRLNVVPIHIPPLRERREDIPLLLDHFLEKIQRAENAHPKRISPEAVDYLTTLDWPGNVRQLEHAVQKAFALSGDRRILFPGDFSAGRPAPTATATPAPTPVPNPAEIAASAPTASRPVEQSPNIAIPPEGIDFDEVVGNFELALLNQALTASGGNKAKAADLLHMKRTTLLAKMKTFEERNAACLRKGPNPGPQRPTALVFEENSAVRKLIVKTIEDEGYRVLEAGSDSAALDLFQCWTDHINLIVGPAASSADSTKDVTVRLRSMAPCVPMIVLSDHRYAEHLHLEHPRTEILQRPFSHDELLASLKALKRSDKAKVAGALCA